MATTPKPAVLTLRAQTVITDPPQILAYEIAYFLKAPASASDTTRPQMISYVDIISRNTDISTICAQVNTALSGVFQRIFGAGNAIVSVTSSSSDGVNYTLSIEPSVTFEGETYTISEQIAVDNNGRLVLTF